LLPKKGPAQTDTQSIETAPDPPQESPNKEVNWLKDSDMLPAAHPEARIMTFGYPRTLERTDVSPADGLFLVAKALLQQLGKIRSPHSCNSRRPIIFIGHSFGGIVIEKALVLAASDGHSEISEDNDILKSTVGVIFLSTPFQGFRIHPASPGNSNRVALLSGSPRLSVDSRATEMSAQSHSGEAVASSSATARGDSWPRVVGSHGSAIPVVAESNSPHHRSLASLLNTEYGHKTLNDLFHNFIETVQTQHIRMACFVNGPLPKLTETRLQVRDHFYVSPNLRHVLG
jgi:hypothetical protein